MPVFRIEHLTTYRYRKPVPFGEHRLMLRPREGFDQRLLSNHLAIAPEPVALRWRHDAFGNAVGVATFDRPSDTLVFDSRVTVEHTPTLPPSDGADMLPAGPDARFAYPPEERPDVEPCIAQAEGDDGAAAAWARRFAAARGPTAAASLLAAMTHAIREGLAYAPRFDGRIQPPGETLARASGTCRDFAVLMIAAARSLGFAARFVSGYVHSPGGDAGREGRGDRRGGGHTHAWVQVHLPSCGWVEFDPTNGIVGGADLVKVAVAREPRQAVPVSGSWRGAARDALAMEVEVAVTEVRAPPARLRRAA